MTQPDPGAAEPGKPDVRKPDGGMPHVGNPDPGDPWADPQRFGTAFQAFLDAFVNSAERPRSDLRDLLQSHFGTDSVALPVMARVFPAYELPNVHLGLQAYVAGEDGRSATGDGTQEPPDEVQLVGIAGLGREYRSFSEMVPDGGAVGFRLGAVDYRAVTIGPVASKGPSGSREANKRNGPNERNGPTAELSCVAFGLFLLRDPQTGNPVAILLRADDPDNSRGEVKLEVMAAQAEVAACVIAAIEAAAAARNVLRGQVLSIQNHAFTDGVGPMRFHVRPTITADDIVMPPGLLERVERQVAGIARHRRELTAAGQHLRRGVLLHGPPGTGKTLTIRYLLSRLPDFTAVLVTGPAIRHIEAACAIARALQPSIVVIEDVDLIAEDRALTDAPQPLLLQMLNELDGLGDDSDVAFVLTTNRVEMLERALVDRPGRIDLAVEIPLPDAEGCRHLFRLYGERVGLPADSLEAAADACGGVTASFAKEAVRRAVLLAAEAGHPVGPDDLTAALDELFDSRNALTTRLLGAADGHDGEESRTAGGVRRAADFGDQC